MFKNIMAVLAAAAVTVGMWSMGTAAKADDSTVLRVMPLGDSITDGFNIVGGYRTTLWKQLEVNGYADNVDLVGPNWGGDGDPNHAGYSGYSIADIPNQRQGIYNFIDWLMESYPADVVLLQIGTNDILSSYELDTMGDRLELLVDAVLSYLPEDGMLYVATIPYMDADVTSYTDAYTVEEMDAAVDNYNAAVKELVARKQSEGKQIVLSDINAQLTKSDLADGVHPNEAGYEKMGNYWYGKLEAYLNGSSEPDTIESTETQPTEPTTEPTEASTTETVTDPTEAPSTEPMTNPTEASTTEPMTDPTETLPTEAPTMAILKGDINWDGKVNVLDVVHLSKYLLMAEDGSGLHLEQADVHQDGVVDVFDLGILKRIVTQ